MYAYTIRLDLQSTGDIPLTYYTDHPDYEGWDILLTSDGTYQYVITWKPSAIGDILELPVPLDIDTEDAVYSFAGWKNAAESNDNAAELDNAPRIRAYIVSDVMEDRSEDYVAVWSEGRKSGEVAFSGAEDSGIQGLADMPDTDDFTLVVSSGTTAVKTAGSHERSRQRRECGWV